jgi:hypothetical protein
VQRDQRHVARKVFHQHAAAATNAKRGGDGAVEAALEEGAGDGDFAQDVGDADAVAGVLADEAHGGGDFGIVNGERAGGLAGDDAFGRRGMGARCLFAAADTRPCLGFTPLRGVVRIVSLSFVMVRPEVLRRANRSILLSCHW